MITASDIAARHPVDFHCDTDSAYAELASKISLLLPRIDTQNVIENIAVSIALYFEDLKSDTYQMEVFTKIYREWFGMYVPFYNSEDASSPSAELDALTFVVWHSICAERNGGIMNPMNEGILSSSKKILDLWHKEKDSIPANYTLADYIFSEVIFEFPTYVRNVLSWIESRSFFGRWYTNRASLTDDEFEIRQIFKNDDDLKYETECLCAFAHQAWPLSLPSTRIYAEMLRTDYGNPDDELATIVEEMDSAPFGMYSIIKVDRSGYTLKDFKNDTYFIPFELSGPYNPKKQYKLVKHCNYIFCGLYRFKGVWRVNGMSSWIDKTSRIQKDAYDEYCEEKLAFYNYTHNYVGLFDDFMARNGGNRLFFFKNINEQIKWSERNFGYQTLMSPPPEIKNRPVMGFIEPCGQMSLSTAVEYVKHPDNPYYNSDADKATLFTAFESESVSPDLALYMIEHDLWQDVGFNDMKGAEHGRLLFQDNIDFMVRCYRRDITRTDIYHRRNKDIFAGYSDEGNGSYSDYIDEFKGNDEFYSDRGLMSFSDFISELKERNEFYSRGNVKLWNLVSCTTKIIIVCDPANDKVHVISSEKLFKAYQELEEDQYKVANLVPYVGKNDASPATALLYSLTNGQINMRLLRQLSKLIMDSFK